MVIADFSRFKERWDLTEVGVDSYGTYILGNVALDDQAIYYAGQSYWKTAT